MLIRHSPTGKATTTAMLRLYKGLSFQWAGEPTPEKMKEATSLQGITVGKKKRRTSKGNSRKTSVDIVNILRNRPAIYTLRSIQQATIIPSYT